MQALRPSTVGGTIDVGAIKTAQIMIERHGFFGLFRGITAVAAGAGKSRFNSLF